jgi:hypothetical protein
VESFKKMGKSYARILPYNDDRYATWFFTGRLTGKSCRIHKSVPSTSMRGKFLLTQKSQNCHFLGTKDFFSLQLPPGCPDEFVKKSPKM